MEALQALQASAELVAQPGPAQMLHAALFRELIFAQAVQQAAPVQQVAPVALVAAVAQVQTVGLVVLVAA